MKLLIGVITIFLLVSCSSVNKEALKEVEELKIKVDSLQERFAKIDHEALKQAKKQYDDNIFQIKKYYHRDTVDKQFMESLDYYRNIKVSSKALNKNREIIGNNFEIVNSQLSILEEDLNNTAIQGKKLKEALANETNNVNQMDSLVSYYVESAETVLFVHDSIAGYIKNKTLNF